MTEFQFIEKSQSKTSTRENAQSSQVIMVNSKLEAPVPKRKLI